MCRVPDGPRALYTQGRHHEGCRFTDGVQSTTSVPPQPGEVEVTA